MKNRIAVIIVLSGFIFGCSQSSNKEVKEANENLSEARSELTDAQVNENEAAKAKQVAEWTYFKTEADSSIASMQNDLEKMGVRIEKASEKNKQKMKADYAKAESNVAALREKLRQQNVEFENDMERFDDNASEKTQSFKREFKRDMDDLGKSLKDLFTDNVK
jgi:hypothetical protein